MSDAANGREGRAARSGVVALTALVLIILFGGYLRFWGLGTRSLWLDEFATWHVSQMPVGQSLSWQPELTKPPLYQLSVRAVSDDPHPPEWLLRLPAAICGVMVIWAAWFLGKVIGAGSASLALAGLVACSAFQIRYSQEARAYSMLVLGCTLSITCWYKLVADQRRRWLVGYVVVTVLSFHAHYLTLLTVGAQVCWWIFRLLRHRNEVGRQSTSPAAALIITALLCTPMVVHYLITRSSVFQGLSWIETPTWTTAFTVLANLTFGHLWVWGLLIPSVVIWLCGSRLPWLERLPQRGESLGSSLDPCGLLLAWLMFAWFGLLVISWVAQPAMVARYDIPAAIPALSIPLVVAYRLDRRAPVIIMLAFAIRAAPDWVYQATEYKAGFHELTLFLKERVDPQTEGVILVVDGASDPGWEDLNHLPFEYYPLQGIPVAELRLASDGVTCLDRILHDDPRGFYVVVLRAEPLAIINAAGRRYQPILVDGELYTQVPFDPYRVVRVAPIQAD